MPTSSGESRGSVCVRYSPFLSHVFLHAFHPPFSPFLHPSLSSCPSLSAFISFHLFLLSPHLPPPLSTLPSPPSPTPLSSALTVSTSTRTPLCCVSPAITELSTFLPAKTLRGTDNQGTVTLFGNIPMYPLKSLVCIETHVHFANITITVSKSLSQLVAMRYAKPGTHV